MNYLIKQKIDILKCCKKPSTKEEQDNSDNIATAPNPSKDRFSVTIDSTMDRFSVTVNPTFSDDSFSRNTFRHKLN